MTVVEIIHTHPFAAGAALRVLLTFCSPVLCAVFLYSLEKTRAMARETEAAPGNQIVPGSFLSSTDSRSAASSPR
jgi:hypothetical protein